MNNRVNILIDKVESVKAFVEVASSFEENLTIKKDRFRIDAKSILGLYSLNLSEPIQLQFDIGITDKVNQKFATWIVPFNKSDVAINFIDCDADYIKAKNIFK